MITALNDSVELSVRHFEDAWRLMCVGAPGYAEQQANGVHYVFSGIPIPFFNVALVKLQLMRPHDDSRCSALVDVNGLAYGMDLDAVKETLGRPAFWSDHFPALGLADETPACAAAVMMVDGYRYVALVATDPARQRRGYGELVLRHALALSARVHGDGPTTLHATEAGRPIYERMGYVPIAAHTVFIERKFLAGH